MWKTSSTIEKSLQMEAARACTINIEFIVQMLWYGEWANGRTWLVFVDFDSIHKSATHMGWLRVVYMKLNFASDSENWKWLELEQTNGSKQIN